MAQENRRAHQTSDGRTRLDRVSTPRAADLVANQLRRHIIHDLTEGQSLPPEASMIETFGVSRQTVREALRLLEADGLVSVRRGALGGAIVHRPDGTATARNAALALQLRDTTIADVFHARAVIEPACAELLAATGKKRDVVRLQEVLQEAADLSDPLAAIRAHLLFHAEVTRLAGNETLALLADVVRRITELDSERRVLSDPTSRRTRRALQAGHKAHERLVELVEARDAQAAREHWRDHLTGSEEYLFELEAKTVLDLFS